MTHLVVAGFDSAESLGRAAQEAARSGYRPQDALTPFPMPEIDEHLSYRKRRPVGGVILSGALLAAAAAWVMQWYSATIDYPFLSGARPYNSWEIFFLVAFEASILFGGIAGFIAFGRDCRLPSLHHSLFEIAAIERATQDRFFLVFEVAEESRGAIRNLLSDLHPLSTDEVAL